MNYESFFRGQLDGLRREGNYRVFADLQREAEFVPETFENASLKLTINARSLAVVSGISEKDRQEIERTMRDALGSTIYSGTSEMQRNIIARWLGL